MGDELAGDAPPAETSALLWLLGAAVLLLAVYVALGYLGQGRREATRRQRALKGLAAALSLGTGIWSAMLLDMSSQALGYMLGLRPGLLLAAWAAAVLPAGLAAALLLRWTKPLAAAGAGLLVVPGAIACQMLMVHAAGLDPGVAWHHDALALAAPVAASGCIGGLLLEGMAPARGLLRRRLRRLAAAAMLAFALVAAQELVLVAADMASQQASVGALPDVAACLVAGLAVPLVLLLLLLAQLLRPPPATPGAPQRRRRRVRTGRVI